MQIVWNEQSIRWFHNASEYTGYNKKFARELLKYIPRGGSLCDIGCGAGLIDFELAPCLAQITCVDISPEAIRAVEHHARRLGLNNISTLCMDASGLEGEWDTVMALFHGGKDVFSKYFQLAKEQLILAAHGTLKANFGPEGHKVRKCFDVNGVREYLDGLGVKYSLQELTLEYGQPLTDLRDAEAFATAYSTPMDKSELDAYLRERLETMGDDRFPYYLPNQKKLGLFVIRRDENERF
ncbi:MAG: class I SAM-dependent methyltransferase [Oscillospiraceae bacterium]